MTAWSQRWLAIPAWVWAAVLMAALLAAMGMVSRASTVPGAVVVHQAQLREPGQAWLEAQSVTLPHTWDDLRRRWRGEAHYRVRLPDSLQHLAREPGGVAVLLPRVGVRMRVLFNGHELAQEGWYREGGYSDAGVHAHLVRLVPALLRERWQDNELEIQIRGESLRISGLSPLWMGPGHVLGQRFDWLHWWQVELTWMVGASALLLAVLSLLIWARSRELLFGLLAAGVLTLALRLLLSVPLHLPGAYAFWDYFHKLSFTWYCGLVYLFMHELFDFRQSLLRKLVIAMLAVAPVWMLVQALANNYVLYRAWTTMVVCICLLALAGVLQRARWGLDAGQRLMVVVGIAVLVTGLRDYLVIQLGFAGDVDIRWMTPGSLVLMFAMGWVLMDRTVLSLEQVGTLNADLAKRVRLREQELRQVFDRLQLAERQRIIESERRRLTRDMHDGLGSQLVQTLNLVRTGGEKADAATVAGMLQHALEELRMTLDSLEPMEGDLATILGTLRRRVAAALDAAGVELDWQVQDVPPLPGLEAQGVMHLFRCLQEIFANVLKHANASRVTVRTGVEDGRIVLTVADNGIGLPDEAGPSGSLNGRGMGNIRIRAAAIGADVAFLSSFPGTCVRMSFPMSPTAAVADR